MTKLPQVTPSWLIRAIRKLKWYSIEEGSEHTIVHDGIKIITTVPRGRKPIKKGTLRGILKGLGISVNKLKELLK